MTINPENIQFVYSGTNVSDPEFSIGGPPSIFSIESVSNGIFDNVNKNIVESGQIDYRCFYIVNNSESDVLGDLDLTIVPISPATSTTSIGTFKQYDIQTLFLPTTPSSGSFTLKYQSYKTKPIFWSSNPTTFKNNLQTELRNIEIFSSLIIENTESNKYDIIIPEYCNFELIEVESNALTPSTSILIEKKQDGSPKNSIAERLPNQVTTPSDVDFSSFLNLGGLAAGETTYVWIRRETFGEISNNELNGFNLKLSVRIQV